MKYRRLMGAVDMQSGRAREQVSLSVAQAQGSCVWPKGQSRLPLLTTWARTSTSLGSYAGSRSPYQKREWWGGRGELLKLLSRRHG